MANKAVYSRVMLINGYFTTLPDEVVVSKERVCMLLGGAARELRDTVQKHPHDTGRLIAALDLLQQAKNAALDALKLPHCVDMESEAQ